MDFSKIKEIVIPEGKVKKIVAAGKVIWQKIIAEGVLPSIYQRVEYIEMAGDQGAIYEEDILNATEIAQTFSLSEFSGQFLCGTYYINPTKTYLTACLSGSGKRLEAHLNSTQINGTNNSLSLDTIYTSTLSYDETTTKLSMIISKNTIVVDSKTGTADKNTGASYRSFGIGCNGHLVVQTDTTYKGLVGRVYELQHKSNGVLVRNFIPCYRKSDGVIGFYDTIKKEFCINKGKGSFVKGPDTTPYKNWVLHSINQDGTIYNDGLGYKNDYRVRSGGAETEDNNSSCTGYIPVKGGDVIRMFGWPFEGTQNGNAINIYNSNFAVLGQTATNSDSGATFQTYSAYAIYANGGLPKDSKGVYTWIVPPSESGIVYIRVSGDDPHNGAPGSKMIVTINEEFIPTFTDQYQEVQYIQAADGVGAYLDLGFTFDKAAYMEIGLYNNGSSAQIFGAAENSGKIRCMITAPYENGVASFYGSTGSAYIGGTYTMTSGKNEFEFSLKKGEMRMVRKDLGTVGTNTTQGEYTMTSNLLLLAQYYNGTIRYGGLRRVYYFKYYDKDNTLICDLVPCYRKSDGVIGMYDKARDRFLTNVGTGSFTKGADVVS